MAASIKRSILLHRAARLGGARACDVEALDELVEVVADGDQLRDQGGIGAAVRDDGRRLVAGECSLSGKLIDAQVGGCGVIGQAGRSRWRSGES